MLPGPSQWPQGPVPPPIAFAVVAAHLVLVGAIVAGELSAETPPSSVVLAFDVVIGVAGSAALPWLATRPVLGATGLAVLAALSPAATPLVATSTLWVARRHPLTVAGAAAAGGVSAHLARALWRPVAGLSPGWWLVVVVASFAALVGWGAWVQARRALLASLEERARRAEAEQADREDRARRAERTRIAREMHDVLAHRLSLLATFAGALEYHPEAPPGELTRAAQVIRTGAHQALEELRDVIGVLRHDGGPAAGMPSERPQPTLADLVGLVEESRHAGLAVAFDDEMAAGADVPVGSGRTAYRIVQEALTNARKHAPGQPVRVNVGGRVGSGLALEIASRLPSVPADGVGVPGSGTGLVGLAERVELAGGRLRHGPSDGEFLVQAWLPWVEPS